MIKTFMGAGMGAGVVAVAQTALLFGVMSIGAQPARADETGFASIHEWRIEGNRTCFTGHYHYGSGEGATKKAAQTAAIKAWQEFTALEYGSDWARFSIAGSKSVSFSKAASGWSASVEARPCYPKRRK